MANADLVLVDGRLAGVVGEAASFWLAIGSGRIVARGYGPPPPSLPRAQRVELGGRVVAPAFVDHHVHLLNIGLSLHNRDSGETLYLDLAGSESIDSVARAVAGRAAASAADEWILGKGWSQGSWGSDELPDRERLDRAAPQHPVFLTRVDAHAGWANGEALRRAGLLQPVRDPAGGEIRRRPDGTPTGVLLERANEPVVAALPPIDDQVLRSAFRRGASALAGRGVTDVFDAGFLAPPGIVALNFDLERVLEALLATDRDSPLPLRIGLMVPAPSALAEKVLSQPNAFRALTPRIGVTHLKLFADGALGSRGASLSHPFVDDPSTDGVVRMSEEEIVEWTKRAIAAGLDVSTHAIGDAAVERTIAAYTRILDDRPQTDPGRLRIEHFSYASERDMRRAADLGVVLSVQPNFVLPDDDGRTMEDARLGKYSRQAYAWGRLEQAGAQLAGGSDYFTVPFSPLYDFHAAATRSNERALPAGGWHPQERLTRAQAWKLFTLLYPAGGGEPTQRTLAVGDVADLTILSADPLQVVEKEIPDIRVHATLLGGDVTHHDGTLAGLAAQR